MDTGLKMDINMLRWEIFEAEMLVVISLIWNDAVASWTSTNAQTYSDLMYTQHVNSKQLGWLNLVTVRLINDCLGAQQRWNTKYRRYKDLYKCVLQDLYSSV